jgi:hypothetical protein
MSSPPNQIRIRLEGRLEVLEVAVDRYEALAALLKGNWQRTAIEEQQKVRDFLSEEPALDDAIAHAERLAEREGWPPNAEARRVWARVAALRTLLQARFKRSTWAQAIEHLSAVAGSTRLPRSDELVLLQGTAARPLPLWALTLAPTLIALSAFGGLAAAGVMVSMVCLGLAVLPLGRYVLLADRLVWMPYRGVPLEVTIDALDAVHLERRNTGLAIEAKRALKLPVVTSPVQLATLLLLCRSGPLKGINRPPAGTVLILAAWISRPNADLRGVVLLYGGGMCFLPNGTAPELVQKLASTAEVMPISETFVLEQLSRLAEPQLAKALEQIADLPGGVYARAAEITADPGARSGKKLRLRAAGSLIEIPIGGVDFEALRTLFPWTQDRSRQVN